MEQLWRYFDNIVPFLGLVVIFAVVGWAILTRIHIHSHGLDRQSARVKAGSQIVVATTLAPVAWLVLIPTGRRVKEMSERLTGLIPGSDITSSLRYVDSWDSTQLWQMLGNAMMLLPFGAVLPLCVARVQSLSQCAVTVVSVSAGIEFVQLIVPILGRAASFDDILLNSLGGIAGALLTRRWWNTSSAPSTTDELDHSATVT